ncbi:MAG: aromatic ring-hydroxylating dioxygenase subunit alpha [Rhodospirillaceae bacterium]|jgi:nitrite reductase/ring-hydroxylating ferredoxin subunit|nr:aromatic ring-hydroxylating dioxygenase subunit alpha [Rhodospirillaceae bacterium]
MAGSERTLKRPFNAYHRDRAMPVDPELQETGWGMPCGEYLRRFWQPVALSEDLGDRPLALRILGDDLVVFRDGSGRPAVLEKHCCHRGTSLEFGKIEEQGIRCCYHGWLFAPDGAILETPGEPPGSRVRDKVFQGAYPAHEFAGIVFAYMGPPEEKPAFPDYDLWARRAVADFQPYKIHNPCNWLQVRENEMDPVHITFLHTRHSGVQFTPCYGAVPTIEWQETPVGMMYVSVRRWGDFLYLRSNDMILPNIARVAGIEDAEGETEFDRRSGATNWVVPIDDANCWTIGWDEVDRHIPEEGRDGYLDRMARRGANMLNPNSAGQTAEPTYEMRQAAPGDWDAWTSQGPVTSHSREHLGLTDRGVTMYRRLVRDGVRAVAAGQVPKGLQAEAPPEPLRTFANNTVKRVPPAPTEEDDRALRLEFGREITERIMRGEIRYTLHQAAE